MSTKIRENDIALKRNSQSTSLDRKQVLVCSANQAYKKKIEEATSRISKGIS